MVQMWYALENRTDRYKQLRSKMPKLVNYTIKLSEFHFITNGNAPIWDTVTNIKAYLKKKSLMLTHPCKSFL